MAETFSVGTHVTALWGHRWYAGVVDDILDGGRAYEIAWADEETVNACAWAVQVPCGHIFCSDCLAQNQSLGKSRHDCPVCRTPFRSRGVTVADVARDSMKLLMRGGRL